MLAVWDLNHSKCAQIKQEVVDRDGVGVIGVDASKSHIILQVTFQSALDDWSTLLVFTITLLVYITSLFNIIDIISLYYSLHCYMISLLLLYTFM